VNDSLLWLAPLGTVLISAMTFWAGWIARIAKGEAAALEVGKVATDVVALRKSFGSEIGDVKKDLAEFKVHVASTYASHDTIRQVEERLIAAIDRLGDRLDKVFEPRG
jgi:hypothetical protein